VAAEVIGTPDYSIGEKLYMAKIYFSTDELFAWTMTILILSFLFEKAVMAVLRKGLEVRI
jgi:NitT/TauT family transport system permease protein